MYWDTSQRKWEFIPSLCCGISITADNPRLDGLRWYGESSLNYVSSQYAHLKCNSYEVVGSTWLAAQLLSYMIHLIITNVATNHIGTGKVIISTGWPTERVYHFGMISRLQWHVRQQQNDVWKKCRTQKDWMIRGTYKESEGNSWYHYPHTVLFFFLAPGWKRNTQLMEMGICLVF